MHIRGLSLSCVTIMILKPVVHDFMLTDEFRELGERIKGGSGALAGTSIEGIHPSSYPLIIAAMYETTGSPVLVITEHSLKMQEIYTDMTCLTDEAKLYTIPSWDTLPYEYISPPEHIERDRVTALYRLLNREPAVYISTVESLVRKIPSRDYFTRRGMDLTAGDEYPFDDMAEMLTSYGYTRERQVQAYGQFAVKGGIIDLFIPSLDNPVRLDFFGDTLESIREFDILTQVSHTGHDSVTLYPRKEIILFKKEREKLLEFFRKNMKKNTDLPEDLRSGIDSGDLDTVPGIEDVFPAVIDTADLLSFVPEDCVIVYVENTDLISRRNLIEKTFDDLHERKKSKTICLSPERLLEPGAFDRAMERALTLQVFTASREGLNWQLKGIPNFHGRITKVREELAGRLEHGWKVVVTTAFEGQARRLYDLLGELNPDSDFDEIRDTNPLNIVISPFREGVELTKAGTFLLTDHEIFGKSYRKKKQFKKKTSRPIESFLDLNPGDYVVHINHGIGIFKQIERMSAGGVERDFLMIEYVDGDKLYVPLDQITLVQKYIGIEGRKPRLDYLGKKSAWNRIKKKVQESVEEIARELIKIYSYRNAMKGHQFPPDTLWQEEFEALFEYEETPDQITAIEDVKDDMESPKPMDRLVCGDVGFGKTEVAIRASFKSVMAGKQVSILVPTTVLAMQHFATFKKRFAEYPIEVEMISRFRTQREIKLMQERLAEGEIDIVIGTHALLSKNLTIKNLGLLIIDEEQRFGVKHKEELKRFRTLVDVLTLTATPIPRTMHMAMSGIRDLSVIATPPENRQSIETYVMEDNPDILRMAILNEIERKGQVFFVHNRVRTIDAQEVLLKKLVPEASFCVAHGQMNEHELEAVMIEFLEGRHDVLISSTIIESGLDMPNVNTIIINRAETFGLSQLYQLKGRVGRSVRKAYAYLFYPKNTPLSEDAQKRLQVISEYSDLGSGFKIAMKDLEIRGAGNILGHEQSGSIMEVGFELYTQMLEDAVKNLKGERPARSFRTPVFLKTDFYIPDEYIDDERQKIEFYKRFESCETEEEIDTLTAELTDRFGPVPREVTILIELEKIRTLASSWELGEILEDSKSIRMRITADTLIDRGWLVEQIAGDSRLTMDRNDEEVLLFTASSRDNEKKLIELKKWLQQIQ